MKTNKIFATFACLMLVLGIVGFSYAHWEKIITLDGTVNTGNVDLKIISVASDDPPGAIDPGKDKDVGTTTIIVDPDDYQRAKVTITNAYPCYEVYLHFTVRNVGTIPVKLQAVVVDAPECITVYGWDGMGEQIDPYDWWTGEPDDYIGDYQSDNSASIHVQQCAEQGATYEFTIEFVYVNWNEYVPPP